LLIEITDVTSLLAMADETTGAMGLYSTELDSYTSDHMSLLESVSRLASTALHHAILNEQARAGAAVDIRTALPISRSPM